MDSTLVGQIQFGMGARQDIASLHALSQQGAHDGATHHATMAGNVNLAWIRGYAHFSLLTCTA